ncbi:amidohydrolase [Amnibacterium flavum]|uniref:amidohydrolase n=1 Tax=Amnibacterium flavum TaxID=2173173 RepID=UPI001F0C3731|nr:amidohydrolase family protein [Amnibacterium flavum]
MDAPFDVLVERGAITRIDPVGQASADELVGDGEVVVLDGRWVIPGLWDEHVHVAQWALASRRLDVSAASSAGETAQIVRASAAAGGGALIIGYGFRDGLWPDLPTTRLLDDSAPGTPVVLVSGDLHCIWLNTLAAERFGAAIDGSGLLRENAAFAVTRMLDDLPVDLVDQWVNEAGGAAAARGVTGIVDLEMDWNATSWARRRASGFDTQRIEFGVYPQHLERAVADRLSTGTRIDELVSVGRLKVLIDGSLNTRTAFCLDPYPGSNDTGMLTIPTDRLDQLIHDGAAAGFEPAIHAIGDRAVGIALDAFERAGIRGRMEHAQLISDADLARFAELGVVASVQPAHLLDDRDVAEHHWEGRTQRAFPLRGLLDSGATVVLGSDAPVSPLDPWVTIAAAVHRTGDERESWHAEQRITTAEAIAASTRAGAAPTVGSPADLAILDADPLTATREGLSAMPVSATLLGGGFTHRAI